MNLETIILNKEDGVTIVRLNRPKEFNALDFHLLNDLARALEFCSDDKETRAVVITGEGKAFCAGGDVSLFRGEDAGDTLRQLIKLMNTVIITIRRMQKPIIAMINGMTAGGGMSIVAACDLRICGSSAKFKTAYTAS